MELYINIFDIFMFVIRVPLILAYFKWPSIAKSYIYFEGVAAFVDSFDPYKGSSMGNYTNVMMPAFLGSALSVDLIQNGVFLNVLVIVVLFVSHQTVYKPPVETHMYYTNKIFSVICFNAWYLFLLIVFAYVIRIYRKISMNLVE